MLELHLYNFEWDEGNREKCQKHGVSIAEIEALFLCDDLFISSDGAHSLKETRFIATGRTPDNRHLFVGFTLRRKQGNHVIRPITARYMHKKEVNKRDKENP